MLKVMLAYLPFGLSKDEAVCIVNGTGGVGIGNFLNAPSAGNSMSELSGWAKSKLGPKMAQLKSSLADQYLYTNDDWFMIDELLNCLRVVVPDMSPMDDDRCLLLVEKNFAGKLNAVDFWFKVSGETSFLGGGKPKSKPSINGVDKSAQVDEGGSRGGICGCLGKNRKH